MTNEELLAKYLENSLTETESAEFQKLLNSSPEFARDVRELSKIEGFLSAGTISAAVPEDFLASVEHHVTEKIHHDKYHAAGSGNTFNKILSGFWILPVLLLVGVGGFFLLQDRDEKMPPAVNNNTTVLKENTAPAPEMQPQAGQPAEAQLPDVTKSPETVVKKDNSTDNTAQPPVLDQDELQGKIEYQASNSDKIVFEKTRENLNKARAEGSKAKEAAILKQMGIISAKMGNTAEARAYFTDAANLAHGLRLSELEGEVNGELGLVFKNESNTVMAAEHFKKAIELLKGAGKSTERWEKELKTVRQ